jgi:hypothetical protein
MPYNLTLSERRERDLAIAAAYLVMSDLISSGQSLPTLSEFQDEVLTSIEDHFNEVRESMRKDERVVVFEDSIRLFERAYLMIKASRRSKSQQP